MSAIATWVFQFRVAGLQVPTPIQKLKCGEWNEITFLLFEFGSQWFLLHRTSGRRQPGA